MTVDAYDRLPRAGGRKFGEIVISAPLRLESTALLTEEDWSAEGFDFLTERGARSEFDAAAHWRRWVNTPVDLWVVDFEVSLILPPYIDKENTEGAAIDETERRGGGRDGAPAAGGD
ncbi:MAG: hypothetical protein RLY93_20680 [Sumerlaeia bacterium]